MSIQLANYKAAVVSFYYRGFFLYSVIMILQATSENLEKCAKALKQGELVAFPTETVYGLGANACDQEAVSRIYKIKGRISTNPLIVHLHNYQAILKEFDKYLNRQQQTSLEKLSKLWPGPLSVILPKTDSICTAVTAGGPTVAVRVPNHPVALKLLEASGLPVAAPSANKSLLLSPTTALHVEQSFEGSGLLILDGGECAVGLESTVLDLCSEELRILRPGAISAEQISDLTGRSCLVNEAKSDGIIRSPGQLDIHYAPKVPLVFIEDLSDSIKLEDLAVLLLSEEKLSEWQTKASVVKSISKELSLEQIARKLYAELRELERLPIKIIAIERCEEKGLGIAIMDRLKRATARQ